MTGLPRSAPHDVRSWLASRADPRRTIARTTRDGPPPASAAQRRMWFEDQVRRQINEHTAGYHCPLAIRIRHDVDVAALRTALDGLVGRHEVLRTGFGWSDGTLQQRIRPPHPVDLPVEDVPGDDPRARERRLAARMTEVFRRPFRLEAEGPFRAHLFRVDRDDNLLLVTIHHIATDGWSMEILYRELSQRYAAARRRLAPDLPELPIQYADYAHWQRHTTATADTHLQFWLAKLRDAPTLLEPPADRRRPASRSFRGDQVTVELPEPAARALGRLARAENTTPFTAFLAAFQLLIARWSGQDDLLIGTPAANRTCPETEPLIGFFVNLLPLRLRLDEHHSFRHLLRRAREVVLESFEHQETPFDHLVERISPERTLAHHPLVQVVLSVADPGAPERGTGSEPARLGELVDFRYDLETHYDLTCVLRPTDRSYAVDLHFATDLFDRATIQRLGERFVALLDHVTGRPDDPLLLVPAATANERGAVVAGNGPGRSAPSTPDFVQQRVAAAAARRPDRPAVTAGATTLSFADLDGRADRLAALLAGHGVGPERTVAVCLPRGVNLVVALLGVLRAGGVYLPLDPSYPPDRRSYMLADSGATVVVTDRATAAGEDWPPGVSTVWLDDPAAPAGPAPRPTLFPDNVAYVLYTSGSTGLPKAVQVTHAGLGNVCAWYAGFLDLGPDDRVSQLVTPGCDASLLDILPSLSAGARVVVLTEEEWLNPPGLWETFARAGVTASFLVTPVFTAATGTMPGTHPTLRRLQVGGDRLPAVPAGVPCALANVYGPTEAAIAATGGWLAPGGAPHIGTAIDNTRVYVLDRWWRPVPPGVVGDLYVSGRGVARGYRGHPGMTAARFVPDVIAGDGSRMYRTGDRARWSAHRLEFLGRDDELVKIRGFRVEPGEVEAALTALDDIVAAVVVARSDLPGGTGLVAFYRSTGDVGPGRLRERLAQRLPAFMLPAAFVPVDAFPLNANAKVDRAALAEARIRRGAAPGEEYVPPRGAIQELVARVWGELLDVDRVSATDDFFHLGGHSLLAMQVVSRVAAAVRCPVPILLLFEAADLASFAAAVEDLVLDRALAGGRPPDRRES